MVSWRMQQNLQLTDGTRWNKMEQDGTRWSKCKQGTSSKWTCSFQFCCNLWLGWSHLVTFFCHEIRLAELCESASSELWSSIFWPKATGRNRTTDVTSVVHQSHPVSVMAVIWVLAHTNLPCLTEKELRTGAHSSGDAAENSKRGRDWHIIR